MCENPGDMILGHQRPVSRGVARLLAAGLLAAACTSAAAGSVSLVPVVDSAPQGSQVSYQLVANFGPDAVLGGTVDVTWDSNVIDFTSFDFDPGMDPPRRDTSFDIIDPQAADLVSIGLARFAGLLFDTDTVIGVVTFDVTGASGSSPISLTDSLKWGPFFDMDGTPLVTQYAGAQAFVAAPVPIPATGWLSAMGLATLGWLGRRSRGSLAGSMT